MSNIIAGKPKTINKWTIVDNILSGHRMMVIDIDTTLDVKRNIKCKYHNFYDGKYYEEWFYINELEPREVINVK